MGTDAYLNIVLPGMTDWGVEPVLSSEGTLLGYQISRTQVCKVNLSGQGKEHLLDDVRKEMEARAKTLNDAAEPLVRTDVRKGE
jgi:hypothetical protein